MSYVVLTLAQQALEQFEDVPLAVSVRRAVRLAHVRGDYNALWWLSLEQGSLDHRAGIRGALWPHYSREEFERLHHTFTERYIRERTIRNVGLDRQDTGGEVVESNTVGALENKRDYLERAEADERTAGELNTVVMLSITREEIARVLEDIRVRVLDYICRAEAEELAGQRPEILVRTREYVLGALAQIAPRAGEQLLEA